MFKKNIIIVLIPIFYMAGCTGFPFDFKRSPASQSQQINPVATSYLKLIKDQEMGIDFLGSRAPLVSQFNLASIPTLLTIGPGKDDVLMIGFPKEVGQGQPPSFKLSVEDINKMGIQETTTFLFISANNAPESLKKYYSQRAVPGLYLDPSRSKNNMTQKYLSAQLFIHYVHEAFHLAQMTSGLLEFGNKNKNEMQKGKEFFCEKSYYDTVLKFFNDYTFAIHDFIYSLSQSENVRKKKLVAIVDVIKQLKEINRDLYEFIKNMEYVEGSAAYVGTAAAIEYADISLSEAIEYKMGYSLDSVRSGNDLTYRNGALAGLIADGLGVEISWDRSEIMPQIMWWEILARTLLSNENRNQIHKKNINIQKPFQYEFSPREMPALINRYCK